MQGSIQKLFATQAEGPSSLSLPPSNNEEDDPSTASASTSIIEDGEFELISHQQPQRADSPLEEVETIAEEIGTIAEFCASQFKYMIHIVGLKFYLTQIATSSSTQGHPDKCSI